MGFFYRNAQHEMKDKLKTHTTGAQLQFISVFNILSKNMYHKPYKRFMFKTTNNVAISATTISAATYFPISFLQKLEL